ncbi:hypothetical protein COU78_05295 [Candidatus Peregrinibacteria bacterium CG10_big_fil_rev_8_21_14_0_10_49_24]|nr:MAG: hypothetical protein COV83_01665 [Candidatus Peregrinibacteria bacterium CG11_big_fil_rev_8_21_14_0_20_49_14]PIR50760.1 MAG: hypothetical protein COU78_05295 [Candidatus Peregrinibacteria bacterium CG10_big_fil_rev_8_21_14_0_10_49_24]PJA68195.1 MAG: hypothetical protein CO157_00515 [Candidatus Peregrinibacteria bacterium CG_4_9_14_3_um_filter_49_12]
MLSFMREFGDPVVDARADQEAMELHGDMAETATRLATAMWKVGEIEAAEFNLTIEAIQGQITLDQAREWAMELEEEVREKQLTGELADDEELNAALEAKLSPPVLSIQEMVEAQLRALHEQAGIYGMTPIEIAEAEREIRKSAKELFQLERDEEDGSGDEKRRTA